MNQTLKLLTERGSCRAFKDQKVPRDVTRRLIEAGIHAPTGGNLQPYSVIRIEKPGAVRELAGLCGQKFMEKAPLHFVYCVDLHRLKRWAALQHAPYSADRALRPFWLAFQDTVICAHSMCVAAESLGLGSVYIGPAFDQMAAIRRMCRLPKGVVPVVSLAVGYPAARPPVRPRLAPEAVVHDEVYRELPDKELLAAYAEKYKGISEKISAERLAAFERTCAGAQGRAFARKCAKAARAAGYFNVAQLRFGLDYKADLMLRMTPKHLGMLKAAGLGWPCARPGKLSRAEVRHEEALRPPVSRLS